MCDCVSAVVYRLLLRVKRPHRFFLALLFAEERPLCFSSIMPSTPPHPSTFFSSSSPASHSPVVCTASQSTRAGFFNFFFFFIFLPTPPQLPFHTDHGGPCVNKRAEFSKWKTMRGWVGGRLAGRIRRHSGMDFQMKQRERDDIMAKSARGVCVCGGGGHTHGEGLVTQHHT